MRTKISSCLLIGMFVLSLGCSSEEEVSLTDLPWLKEIVDGLEASSAAGYSQHVKIYQCTYRDGIGFWLELCVGCPDASSGLRSYEGKPLCSWGGFTGGDPCVELFDIDFENKTLIYELNKPN
jgi:hypothetical protein